MLQDRLGLAGPLEGQGPQGGAASLLGQQGLPVLRPALGSVSGGVVWGSSLAADRQAPEGP